MGNCMQLRVCHSADCRDVLLHLHVAVDIMTPMPPAVGTSVIIQPPTSSTDRLNLWPFAGDDSTTTSVLPSFRHSLRDAINVLVSSMHRLTQAKM